MVISEVTPAQVIVREFNYSAYNEGSLMDPCWRRWCPVLGRAHIQSMGSSQRRLIVPEGKSDLKGRIKSAKDVEGARVEAHSYIRTYLQPETNETG